MGRTTDSYLQVVVSGVERETNGGSWRRPSTGRNTARIVLYNSASFVEKICVILWKMEGDMRRLLIFMAAITAALVLTGASLAATPTQIYRDFADNGRLDMKYSKADLDRALKDAVLQGYGNGNVTNGLPGAVAGETGGAAGAAGILPFTGLDLTLMALGGGALLAAGAGLRRFSKSKA
jgi:hypothetical protein